MNREDREEIKWEIVKILTRFEIASSEQWYTMDGDEGCELYEDLKAGVVEVFDLDDGEMDEILDEVLTSLDSE